MSPDEWLAITRWLDEREHGLTVDLAARFGAAWRKHDAAQVKDALEALIGARVSITIAGVNHEISRRASRWVPILETRHRELFPDGCANRLCEVCLDIRI